MYTCTVSSKLYFVDQLLVTADAHRAKALSPVVQQGTQVDPPAQRADAVGQHLQGSGFKWL